MGDHGWPFEVQARWGMPIIGTTGHNWHLLAIHRTMFERIGFFDENFYPAYFEDSDWIHRATLVGVQRESDQWQEVWINAITWGSAQHQVVDMPAEPLIKYFEEKWGPGSRHGPRWDRPFQSRPLDYWESPSIPELVRKYELKNWW